MLVVFMALSTNILPTNEAIIDYLYLQLYITHKLTKYCPTTNNYFDPLKISRYSYEVHLVLHFDPSRRRT